MAEEKVRANQEESPEKQKEPKMNSVNEQTVADDLAEEKEPEIVESEEEKSKREHDELQEKYLRLYSDFENFRRRTAKEKIDLIDYASENVIKEILPVVDDFERALHSMNEKSEIKGVFAGLTLIFNKLNKILEDKGLSEIECIGKEFDPDIHEALTKIPAPKKKLVGKVVDQIQKGYSLKGKVIRHSKVVVGE